MNPVSKVESVVLSLAPPGSAGAAALGIAASINQDRIMAVTGVVLAVLTFGLNAFYRRRQDARDTEMHRAQMQRYS